MVQKAEVEITEKEKTPAEQALAEVLKRIEKPVQPPPIEETLDKANQAMIQAKKAQHKPLRQTWYCTDCGGEHIQNDGLGLGLGHISVDAIDGEFVDASSGAPLTGKPAQLMAAYAVPKVERGSGSQNKLTLSKMKELKGK